MCSGLDGVLLWLVISVLVLVSLLSMCFVCV